jgi:hypothetical protein
MKNEQLSVINAVVTNLLVEVHAPFDKLRERTFPFFSCYGYLAPTIVAAASTCTVPVETL